MDKKEKLFNTLNNHFNLHNEFPEFSQIDEEDIEKIIALYEQEASKGGKDPWHYLYIDELIIMQKCVYDVIKNNPKYSAVTDKIEILYHKELDRRLQRSVRSYGEETGETYRASYAEMPEYSLVLADMCTKNMVPDKKTFEEKKRAIDIYQQIRTDFIKAGKQMPMSYEMTLEYAQGEMARRNVGGTPREPAIEPVYGAENNREVNLRETQERKAETPIHTEAEKQEIREQMRQAQEQLAQTLEWAKQQPNEPTVTSIGGNNATMSFPEDIYIHDDDLENYINSNFNQFGKVDKILSVSGYPVSYYEVRFENGEVHSIPDKRKLNDVNSNQDELKNGLVNEIIQNGLANGEISEYSPLPDIKKRLMGMSVEELQNTLATMQPQSEQTQQITQEESQKILQEQEKQMKTQIINQIMAGMNNAGEFSFGDISMGERMNIMRNVQNKLNAKSIDELQMLLSTYQEQNVQEESMSNGMRR